MCARGRAAMTLIGCIELAYQAFASEAGAGAFFDGLRRILPFASGLLLPVDPSCWRLEKGVAPGMTDACVERYLAHETATDPMLAGHPSEWSNHRVMVWSSGDADGANQCERFREFARTVPFDHVLSVLCGYREHPTVLFRLHRRRGEPEFSPDELALAAALVPHLGRSAYLSRLADRPDLALPRAILVVGQNHRILYASADASDIIGGGKDHSERLLAHVRSGGSWFSIEHGMGFRVRPLPLGAGSLLTGFASRRTVVGQSADAEAYVLEPVVPRSDLRKRLLSYGLTARELEIGLMVVQGFRYKEIARTLAISEQTVRDHLRSVFRKVGVRTGGALVAKIVGVTHLRLTPPRAT